MSMEMIQYMVEDRIGYITMNRPEKKNALSFAMVSDLKAAFAQAGADDNAKVIVLRAHGDAFCAGADLSALGQLQQATHEENLEDSRHLASLFHQIYTHKKIIIAQIQGHAIAGGCGLATVCDFAFATPESKFGYTEVRIGFIPAIVTIFLLRKIGEQRARQFLLTGDLVSAAEAATAGIINHVVAANELAASVSAFAGKLITRNSAGSMKLTKQMIAAIPELPLEQALDYAAQMNAQARGSDDCRKGIAAFLNKQDLKW